MKHITMVGVWIIAVWIVGRLMWSGPDAVKDLGYDEGWRACDEQHTGEGE